MGCRRLGDRPSLCRRLGAGLKATAAMRKLIEGKVVTCEFRGHDRYRR
jgi:hypothetical protein